MLIGSKYADEAVELFQEWWQTTPPAEREAEMQAAQAEAAHGDAMRVALEQAASEAPEIINEQKLDQVAVSVAAGLNLFEPGKPVDFKTLKDALQKKTGTYAVWLNLPAVVGDGPGRYCHFYWTGESYRARDFIGGRIFHPPGSSASKEGLTPVELPLTALGVWQAARGRVQCLEGVRVAIRRGGQGRRWGGRQTPQMEENPLPDDRGGPPVDIVSGSVHPVAGPWSTIRRMGSGQTSQVAW
jgi:hypothetical protein